MQQARDIEKTCYTHNHSNTNTKIINSKNAVDGEERLPCNEVWGLDTGLDHGGLSEPRYGDDDEDGDSDTHSDQGGDTSNCDHSQMHASLANRETRAVTKWKLVVLVVLLLSAIGTAWSVYYYIHNSETTQFHQAFDNSAQKVLESIGIGFEKTLKSLDSLAVEVVSHAIATNQTWPFVTVPHFPFLAAKMISNSDAILVILLPLVAAEKRAQWENYTMAHNQWVNESVRLQEDYAFYNGPLNYNTSKNDGVIYGDFGPIEYDVERNLLPSWQAFPVINYPGASTYGWDYMSALNIDGVTTALDQHRVIISEAQLLPDPLNPVEVEEASIWAYWYSGYVQAGKPTDEPLSEVYFPIFEKLDSIHAPSWIQDDEKYDTSKHRVVGLFAASLYWRDLISDILPPGSEGIVVVFENPCNPTFTYQINGPVVAYLGRGDLHDPTYDHLELSSPFFDLNSFSIGTSLYSGPSINKEFCTFRLRVFPSDDMKEDYSSKDPVILSVAAVCIFIFTSAVFLFYDYNVEKRQRLVLNTAERSTAIVSSLFPAIVREQLADAVVGDKAKEKAIGISKQHLCNKQKQVQDFLEQGDTNREGGELQSIVRDAPPIASLYPDTTVMFADIVGFTQWSSTRQPADVFTLLETLYGAFDAIAMRRKVFKVETIGDCYVAVTGLPTPEARHAVIMVKFAMDCRYKMEEITRQLEATLGPDTGSLALRVGLHSGPTTAGVLRGAKSRFQLFGDTVNTAARMESHSSPQKIHVSQTTADLLVAAGKRCWLVKRDELIEAKGKGKMQTWWVNPSPSGAASVSVLSCDDSSCVERPSKQCSVSACGERSDAHEDELEEGIEILGVDDNIADLEPPTTLDGMITMPESVAAEDLHPRTLSDSVAAHKPQTTRSDETSIGNDNMVTPTMVTTLEECNYHEL